MRPSVNRKDLTVELAGNHSGKGVPAKGTIAGYPTALIKLVADPAGVVRFAEVSPLAGTAG